MSDESRILHYIEVENVPHIWAVTFDECKKEMQPIIPKFIMVHNDLSNDDLIFVDNTLLDRKPEKIIDGVNGGIADSFIQVGFWRVKDKNTSNRDYALSA